MSRHDKYYRVKVSANDTIFKFTSVGPQGNIELQIQFTPIEANNIFNLAFGNKKSNGEIDDSIINNNRDRNKILATVASAVFDFTELFPDSYIYFSGSTNNRNRLYRMAITLNYIELSRMFKIWGLTEDDNLEPFEKTCSYKGFLIQRNKP